MGKRLDQTLQTKENLKTAFWNIYQQKPLDQITVREVTDLAGYNRGTFYVYYKDVYDLLEQIEQEIVSIFETDQHFGFEPHNREQFEDSIRFFISFIDMHQKYLLLLAGDRGDPKFMHRLWRCIYRTVFQKLRPLSELDEAAFSYLVNALISVQSTLVMRWFQSGKDLPLERLIDLLYQLTYFGPISLLTPEKAQEDLEYRDDGRF